ncbi:serine/threonine-protein kinase [Catellatospora sp. KI3]|uniref:serine/threonine-protein kinase n=1 Tax=Catellatospora sp. KI3 TaxID=3041620 RepID=UPI00248329D0|nr:serine/threonine-protein kinase [Catellatospora sp. KI3]MDI1463495.1 serine/threonine-protein kinase [Catellatospora sp. KI3]
MPAVPSLVIADRYRLLQPLGQGGMGVVWLARDETLHRDVAVKEVVPPAGLTEDERAEMNARSLREARAIARLSHPNVVHIFDVVTVDGRPWIVMEYLRGRSLAALLAEQGRLDPAKVAAVGLGVLAALRAAHGAGMLHRDVKPANVMLDDDGRVVLTDFGLATLPGDPAVTRTGLILGSPSYIAPERVEGGEVGPAADLWSLGATLYAAVEGQSPYARPNAMATLAALATEEPPPPRLAGPLKPLLEGLLRRDPRQRMGAAEAERLLRRLSAGQRGGKRPEGVAGAFAPGRAATPAPRSATSSAERAVGAAAVPPATGAAPVARSRKRRAMALGAVAAVVLAVLAAAIVPRLNSEPRGTAAADGSPSATAASSAAASSSPSPTPTALPSPSPAGSVLPSGWHLYRDRTGFAVAVPIGWKVTRDGTIVRFTEPDGGRLLLVDQSDSPKKDPVADWKRQEARRTAAGDWDDYQRIHIISVDYFIACADWEFTYRSRSGRVHVINRGFVTGPKQAHAIYWSTPESRWNDNLDEFALITASFQPNPV